MVQYDTIIADAFGFMKSRVIITAAELDFFTRLDEKPATADELAEMMGLDTRATTRILDSLVALGLLEKQNNRYKNTEKGVFLSSHHPETVLPIVLHMSRLWDGWSHLTDAVRKGNRRKQQQAEIDETNREAFIGAMHAIGRSLSIEIANDYDVSRFKRLLDVGGASGTYTIAFLRKNPEMTAVIFDFRSVIPMAKKRLKAEGLYDRVKCVAGNFHKDELPRGYDLALISAIIHQNSIKQNIELFTKVYRALMPGGPILIRDHIMDESRTKPPAGTLFALNMLVNTLGGDTYTFREVKDALTQAGFINVKLLRTGERMDCLVEAKKPA
ncbi:MAG: methyltransferase [Proteobacteria bacterium]|nr:methyltransferase [Pseudomonadota bacterium]